VTFLAEILRRKREEVRLRRLEVPDEALERRLSGLPATRSLASALSPRGGPPRVIAEVKRASPSAGEIDAGLDPGRLARLYEEAGAAAISVLTDGPGFGGSLADLAVVRAAVKVPVLRKDFVVDGYQLLEARLAGADAALLIVAALSQEALDALSSQCEALSLDAVVEVHDEGELEIALTIGARIVGVNNRNLKTFEVDLAAGERLLPRIPASVLAIAESGVRGPVEALRMRSAGAPNLLVGEALVRAANPGALLQELLE
jgi:indole-3-glycerol phosphate synthase